MNDSSKYSMTRSARGLSVTAEFLVDEHTMALLEKVKTALYCTAGLRLLCMAVIEELFIHSFIHSLMNEHFVVSRPTIHVIIVNIYATKYFNKCISTIIYTMPETAIIRAIIELNLMMNLVGLDFIFI